MVRSLSLSAKVLGVDITPSVDIVEGRNTKMTGLMKPVTIGKKIGGVMSMKKIENKSEEKKFIIVQTQLSGEFALTKADTYEVTANALRRFKAMDIPFIKMVDKTDWRKSKKVVKRKSKKA